MNRRLYLTWFVYWFIVNYNICKHTNSVDKRWISASWIWNITEPKLIFELIKKKPHKQQTTLCSPIIFAWLVLLKWNDFYTLGIRQALNICNHFLSPNWTTAGRSRRHTSVHSSQHFSCSVNLCRDFPVVVFSVGGLGSVFTDCVLLSLENWTGQCR